MGQNEIYNWLKAQREAGNEEYFSVRSIYKAMIEKYGDLQFKSVWRSVKSLRDGGYLDVKRIDDWVSYCRVKEKYIKRKKKEEFSIQRNNKEELDV